ncbi:hypothetical protein [Sinorhizobium medicae]|uniref:hypothetical protein n=1 Tax=Sinorhizobium medicae TaxID=110321 RepID=UPI0019175C6A|nr:hypothetical protein [Sinorhizobium medicae]
MSTPNIPAILAVVPQVFPVLFRLAGVRDADDCRGSRHPAGALPDDVDFLGAACHPVACPAIFGTYRPHRVGHIPFADKHRARSNEFSPLLSLLTCFHFGYHHEHHNALGAVAEVAVTSRARIAS